MTVKEFIISRIKLFFFLTVMILVAQSVVGTIASPGETLHIRYLQLLDPIELAALCTLPTIVSFSRKKLSVKQVLLRHAVQLLLIEGVMMYVAFTSSIIDSSRPAVLLLIAGATLVIYVLAVVIMWLDQLSASRKMTEQLHQLQEKVQAEEEMGQTQE